MNFSININLLSYIKSKKFISEVIHRFAQDSEVDQRIIYDIFCDCDELKRLRNELKTTFIVVAAITLC
jgi:hypothetical protein